MLWINCVDNQVITPKSNKARMFATYELKPQGYGPLLTQKLVSLWIQMKPACVSGFVVMCCKALGFIFKFNAYVSF